MTLFPLKPFITAINDVRKFDRRINVKTQGAATKFAELGVGEQEVATVVAVQADWPSRVGDQTSIVTRHSLFDRVVVNQPETRSVNKRLSLFAATHLITEAPTAG